MAIETATIHAVLTLIILGLAIYGFISEKIPPDVTALLALLALLVTRVLSPTEAFSGFSHPATVSVAAVLVLSAGLERTGVLRYLARRVLAPVARSELLLTIVVMVLIAAFSAFINNTAAVAVFIPIILDVCKRTGISPGRVLMPMAHAATFGGLCTLMGTSTNLVAHEFARSQGLQGFSMFEFGKVGLPMLLAGFAYILLVGRWFLPRARSSEAVSLVDATGYLSEIVIQPQSSWNGKDVRPEDLKRDFDVELVAVLRQGRSISTKKATYTAGDTLLVRGSLQSVLNLADRSGADLHRPNGWQPTPAPGAAAAIDEGRVASDAGAATEPPQPERLPLAEIVVLSSSGLIGRTLKEVRFSDRFDVAVLAIRRRGRLEQRPSQAALHAGDVLVVEGEKPALAALGDTAGFLVIGTPAHPDAPAGKQVIALATLAAVIISVALGLAPIVTVATTGCAVLMLTGCLRPRQAYQAIDLSIVFLLAGSLALGLALEKTGITTALAGVLVHLTDVTGPYAILIGFFVVSVVVSELMSNSGTVALLGPVAVACGNQMGVNPMSLLAAVAFGASAAFAMPIGYQTSLMIYGPGGYRFKDFIRMGIPLDVLLIALGLWLIPKAWPLVAVTP